MKTLLVHGYMSLGSDTYKNLIEWLHHEYSCIELDTFFYKETEDLKGLTNRFNETLNEKYDLIISHSAGCFLVANHLLKYEIEDTKIIFLTPLIQTKTNFLQVGDYVPEYLFDFVYLPKIMFIRQSDRSSKKGWQDDLTIEQFSFRSVKQILQIGREINKKQDAIFAALNAFPDLHIIYSQDDAVVGPFPEEKFPDKSMLNEIRGSHEPFNDDVSQKLMFFKILKQLI